MLIVVSVVTCAGVIVDGYAYFAPSCALQILQLHIATGVTQLVGAEYEGDLKWSGAVTTNGKRIYFIPFNHPLIGHFKGFPN